MSVALFPCNSHHQHVASLQCDNMVPGGENGIFLRVHAGKPKSDGCMRLCCANSFVNLNPVQPVSQDEDCNVTTYKSWRIGFYWFSSKVYLLPSCYVLAHSAWTLSIDTRTDLCLSNGLKHSILIRLFREPMTVFIMV